MQARQPSPSSIRTLAVPALLLGAVGCAEPATSPPTAHVTVRDSAGIQIVENGPLLTADSVALRVDTAGRIRIGVMDGAAPYVFGKIVGVAALDDGGVVVADASLAEIRSYASDGTFLESTGRLGDGPGEYRNLTSLRRFGPDSLFVIDHYFRRWHFLDADGHVRQSVDAAGRPASMAVIPTAEHPEPTVEYIDAYTVIDVYADGSLLASSFVRGCGERNDPPIVCADSLRLMKIHRTGQAIADLGVMPESRMVWARTAKGENFRASFPYPQVFKAASGVRTYIADAEHFEVRMYGPDGKLFRIARVNEPRLSTPDGAFERPEPTTGNPARDALQARMAAALRDAPLPDSLPHFGMLLPDVEGNVWLGPPPGTNLPDERQGRWAVLDSTGVLRHALRAPAMGYFGSLQRVRAADIGRSHIVVYAWDSLGTPFVDVYPLRRPSAAGPPP